MKLTKTSIIGFIGLLTVLFAANASFLNAYVTDAIISLLTLGVYNFWKSDDTGAKPTINILSALSFIAAVSGYFLDHPKDVVENGVHVITYVAPVALLGSLKNTIVAVVRFYEANFSKESYK